MSQSWIRITPRPDVPVAERCEHCEGPISERWDAARCWCARCVLETELFDPEERRERAAQPA